MTTPSPIPFRRRRSAASKVLLPALACAAVHLTGCLQSEPADDSIDRTDIAIPEDEGRLAGASSSTNWPTKYNKDEHLAIWSADSTLRIRFLNTPPDYPPRQNPESLRGKVHLYPGGVIPALDSIHSTSWSFEATDTLRIPLDSIPVSPSAPDDTISFNIHLDMDSLHGMLYGMRFSRRTGKIISPPDSDISARTIYLDSLKYYFRGATSQVTALLPAPVGNLQDISFYIPGTPEYCHAQSDSFQVGPLPKGKYPLRIIRVDGSGKPGEEATIEAWELRVSSLGATSTFSLGERVLSFRARGALSLRDGE